MVNFLDTYAIIEIDKGNPGYQQYSIGSDAITTAFNLIEVHFYYLKNFDEKEAEEVYDLVKMIVVRIDDEIMKEANKFKLTHLKKRFSFADCIGYATARKYNAKFVTGDYMFKGLEGVEFVK